MELAPIGLAAAFGAGVLSFLSPCVLPLIPAYLSFMTGLTTAELEAGRSWRSVLVPSLLFVAGFSMVFIALGASASVLGAVLVEHRLLFERVAGVLVIVFGFLMLGIVKVPWLYGEARFEMGKARAFGKGAAFVMGAAFAFGWTPCVGPVLGTILAMAGVSGSVGQGVLLLAAYSVGLGLPFVATGLLFGRLAPLLSRMNRHSLLVNRIAGVLLIIVGILIVSGSMSVLVGALARRIPQLTI